MKRNCHHWHDRREAGHGRRIVRIVMWGVAGILFAAFLALVLGMVVVWLWNWLMPDIFGLKQITYWQAVGLLFLGRLLIGGFHHAVHHDSRKSCRRGHWKEYGRYWQEKGDVAADELIGEAGQPHAAEGESHGKNSGRGSDR